MSLGVVFFVLVTHSLLYSGFFEDPITWGVLAIAAAYSADAVPIPWRDVPGAVLRLVRAARAHPTRDPRHRVDRGARCRAVASAAAPLARRHRHLADRRDRRHREHPPRSTRRRSKARRRRARPTFGGDPARTLARPKPTWACPAEPMWARRLLRDLDGSAAELLRRLPVREESSGRAGPSRSTPRPSKIIWSPPRSRLRRVDAGDRRAKRLILSWHGGTVAAFERAAGRTLWRPKAGAPVESSPDRRREHRLRRRFGWTPFRSERRDRPPALGLRRGRASSARTRPSSADGLHHDVRRRRALPLRRQRPPHLGGAR